MSIEARPQGCFCERLESGGVRHMTVVYANPGKLLRLVGGLGPLQSEAVTGSLSWNLGEHEGGTRLIVTYKVAGYTTEGLDQWAGPVDEVLAQAARRLKKFVETGSPE
jgi:hypothetical protein